MSNAEIAGILREIGLYLEMDEVPFKPRAYEKAADAVEAAVEPLIDLYHREDLKGIERIPGVGKGIAEKIATLLQEGRLPYYEAIRRKTPVDLIALTRIEGLGPKMVKSLYEALGVRTIDDLEEAARREKIRSLPHFGVRSEEKILKGIAFLKKSTGRLPLGDVLPLMDEIEGRLKKIAGVKEVITAGSIRRRKETVGDADLLVVSAEPERVMEAFVRMPEVIHIYGRGTTKSSVKIQSGLDVDLRVVPDNSLGAALCYFTGSKAHNIAVRKIAQEKKLKLNEYGLFRGTRSIAGRTEEAVYEALGLPWIPPELREDSGEIEAAHKGRLPDLIGYGDLRGDLQIQTTWTDGAHSIEEMAEEAGRMGLEYIAITDHTKSLAMTGGSDEKRLREQMAAIEAINRKQKGTILLKGAEVNINKDGSLDIDDETLSQLDVVGVAVHSHFNLPREEMTRRIIRAMENPHADILFHPTGRRIGRREPYPVDIDALIDAARRTGTVLEIDAFPDRLDLKDDHVRKAVAAGVKLVIDSDAHNLRHMQYLHFGVATARRGWATRDDILNTRPLKAFLSALKDGRKRS